MTKQLIFTVAMPWLKVARNTWLLNTSGEEIPVEGSGLLDVNHFSEGYGTVPSIRQKIWIHRHQRKAVIKAQFETVGYFSDGVAWAKTADKKVGYIDKSGAWVIKPQFDVGKDFDPETGLARIKSGDSWGYITKSGEQDFVEGHGYL